MIEALIIALLALNVGQFMHAQDLKEEAADNVAAIVDYKARLTTCERSRREQVDRLNNFKDAQRIDREAIDNFRVNAGAGDWGDCRVPDNVDVKTLLDGGRD